MPQKLGAGNYPIRFSPDGTEWTPLSMKSVYLNSRMPSKAPTELRLHHIQTSITNKHYEKQVIIQQCPISCICILVCTTKCNNHASRRPRQANYSQRNLRPVCRTSGTCIYGGLWVGENSDIPNVKGYRTDVFNALKDLQVPVLRWPGGCFADEYHWMDGIGPKENRPKMVNNNWGGTIEDNSFGTHEFLNLCEMLGCEPYISGNVGSGTVEELAKWVEYMTSDGDSPMANLRRKNGRDKAWKVKYLGVGNESWGCGGSMRPEYYADLYRRYSTYCRNYDNNRLFKIASGASDYDYEWTKVLMERVGSRMNGLSLHYYTVSGWTGSKGSATRFDKDDYYWTMGKCREIEDVIRRHCAIMDEYDKDKNVALMLDEWGTWWDEEPGTVRGHLYQQNTMRDAFVASLSLDIFHKYTDRLKMANIARLSTYCNL